MGKKKNNGKSPKGRAGAKKKAQKGGPSNAGLMENFMRSSDFSRQMADEAHDEDAFKLFRGFAQAPNSKNMPPHNPALKLRHQAIAFVRASTNTPAENDRVKLSEDTVFVSAEDSEEEGDISEGNEAFDDAGIQTNLVSHNDVAVLRDSLTQLSVRRTPETNLYNAMTTDIDMHGDDQYTQPASSQALPFVVDTEGDESLATAYHSREGHVPARAPSPARSDSSEEVVVFHGRNNANGMNGRPAELSSKAARTQQPSQNSTAHPVVPNGRSVHDGSSTNRVPPSFNASTHMNGTSGPPSAHYSTFPPQASDRPGASSNNAFASSHPPRARLSGWGSGTSKADQQVNLNATWAPAPSHPYWKKPKGRPRPDLNPSPSEIEEAENAPARQSKATFALPQTDGADDVDPETMKKIERLAKITRVQAKDDASPPKNWKKQAKMETRIANITMLESELSPVHVQLARNMGAEEAVRLEQMARDRGDKKREERSAVYTVDTGILKNMPSTFGNHEVSDPNHGGDGLGSNAIASLQSDVKAVLREKQKAKQTSRVVGDDKILLSSPKSKRRGKRGRRQDNRQLRNAMVSDDDDDDAIDDAAYDDYVANLEAQMGELDDTLKTLEAFTPIDSAKSAPIAAALTTTDGVDPDDDEWEDEEDETEDFAADMMADDASTESSGPIGQDRSEISGVRSSELEDELEYNEREQWEDEEDLRRRNMERKTDEQIARLYAKQQELGYHGDEMILDDGEYGNFSDGVGDLVAARAGLANIQTSGTGSSRNKHGMRRGGKRNAFGFDFPDAEAFADSLEQYGDEAFDIMDFDRPSLRPVKKGRRGQIPPDLEALSDEELRDNMAESWANDRAKKRLKKAEREELRSQGLLGALGKKGKADLSQKYQYGMSRPQIQEELRTFLQDDGLSSMPFPPMLKGDRKALHELALALGLNSKSVGTGKDRFPVLYKSSRTPVYRADVFEKALHASRSGWLDTNRKLGRKFARKAAKTGGQAGGRVADATIRNGEVVGAGAAEIGKENFGHKLMEKMGWSKGMALGKEGEGMLTPVEQVMRAGRGGLGG